MAYVFFSRRPQNAKRRTGQAKEGERFCQRPRQTRKGALGWGRSLSANHQRARDEARGGLRDRELGALRDSAPREESTALPKVVRGPHLGTLGAVRWFPGVLHHGLRVCCRSTRCNSDFVRVRNTPACTGAPLFFFSLTLRRRRRTSDKISSSQKFPPPHPALSPKIGSKSRHTQELGLESYSRSGFPRATRSGNGHRSHGRRATSEPTPRSKALRPRQRSRRSGAREIGRAKTLARGSARVPRFRQICGLEGRG